MSHTDTPTVILVNPNTNEETTVMMANLVRSYMAPVGAAVKGITVEHGPSMIIDSDTTF